VIRRLSASLAASLVALTVGCGELTIDSGKAEGLARKVAGAGKRKLVSVSCPEGVKAKKGADFDCDLVFARGIEGTITIHQANDDGAIRTGGADIRVAKGR
jgi:hypothetical protein